MNSEYSRFGVHILPGSKLNLLNRVSILLKWLSITEALVSGIELPSILSLPDSKLKKDDELLAKCNSW